MVEYLNELQDILYYLSHINVPRHVVAGIVGSLGGISIGLLKKKDAKKCLKYGLIGGFSLVTLAELHDLHEHIMNSLEDMVKTFETGYIEKSLHQENVLYEKTDSTEVFIIKETTKNLPVTKEYASNQFFSDMAKSFLDDSLDFLGGAASTLAVSLSLYYDGLKKIINKNARNV